MTRCWCVYVSSHAKGGSAAPGRHAPAARRAARHARARPGARLTVLVVDACESGTLARRKGGSAAPAVRRLAREAARCTARWSSPPAARARAERGVGLAAGLALHPPPAHGPARRRGRGGGRARCRSPRPTPTPTGARWRARPARGSTPPTRWSWRARASWSSPSRRWLAARSSSPPPRPGRYVVSSQPRPDVVAEVEKAARPPPAARGATGALPVRKRAGASTGLLEVELPYGGERAGA